MKFEKILKIGGVVCTVIGAVASIGSSLISEKTTDITITKKVQEEVAKLGK